MDLQFPLKLRLFFLFLAAIIVGIGTEESAFAQPKGRIYNAWWSNSKDVDGDGHYRSFTLNWDPDVWGGSNSLQVFEIISYKASSGTNWIAARTNSIHTITAINRDTNSIQLFGKPFGTYDYKIDIYRPGQDRPDHTWSGRNDKDLVAHREEGFPEDGLVPNGVHIADTSWLKQTDLDQDGYYGTFQFQWDANVTESPGSVKVFETLFYRRNTNEQWTAFYTHTNHIITGTTRADEQVVRLFGKNLGKYDYKITVSRVDNPGVVAHALTPADDFKLKQHPEETPLQDKSVPLYWQNTNGAVAVWYMDGTAFSGIRYSLPAVGPSVQLTGVADLDKDRDHDLIFQHQVSGELLFYYMNGRTGFSTASSPAVIGEGLKLKAINDFDGDGDIDLLFQSSTNLVAGLMSGINVTNRVWLRPVTPGWNVAGMADFNKDGKGDILFQGDNGYLMIWYMDGTKFVSQGQIAGNPHVPGWKVSALANLDRNSQKDIVLQNGQGQLAVWLMNGTTIANGVLLPAPDGLGWKLRGPNSP